MVQTAVPPRHQDPVDPALGDVQRAAEGDEAAFERLMFRYQPDVLNAAHAFVGNHDDALDVAQEAFWKAYRGLSGFRGKASFRTWILTITRNCALSLRSRRQASKRSGHRRTHPGWTWRDVSALADPDTSGAPSVLAIRKEIKDALEAAICKLEGSSREVVVLRHLGGESYESIAALLHVPLGTVKSRVHRARRELQARLTPWR